MQRNSNEYIRLSNLPENQETVSWRKFYVHLAGRTEGAHHDFVKKFKGTNHKEVFKPEDCDYLLVFCPVASRVKTDIDEALKNIPADKPIILVVMHHTFNPEYVVAESRRQVNDSNVRLTVDCLFYNGNFLLCKRNNEQWFEVQNFLGVSQVFSSQKIKNFFHRYWSHPHKWIILISLGVVGALLLLTGLILAGVLTMKKD